MDSGHPVRCKLEINFSVVIHSFNTILLNTYRTYNLVLLIFIKTLHKQFFRSNINRKKLMLKALCAIPSSKIHEQIHVHKLTYPENITCQIWQIFSEMCYNNVNKLQMIFRIKLRILFPHLVSEEFELH